MSDLIHEYSFMAGNEWTFRLALYKSNPQVMIDKLGEPTPGHFNLKVHKSMFPDNPTTKDAQAYTLGKLILDHLYPNQ